MGKGDTRRPTTISQAEERIRWKLAYGQMTFKQFEKRVKELKKRGLVKRR